MSAPSAAVPVVHAGPVGLLAAAEPARRAALVSPR